MDSKSGKVDGAWELSDNLMELRLRHTEPQRKLVLTVDAGLLAVNKAKLAAEYISRLETRDLQASVGFASRGSLLPTRLAEGLPVIALNVDKVDVEFFRIKPDSMPNFLAQWDGASSLSSYSSEELLPMADWSTAAASTSSPRATPVKPCCCRLPVSSPCNSQVCIWR